MEAERETLTAAMRELGWESQIRSLERLRANAERDRHVIGFVGQFSAGKSALINCLLGVRLLPEGLSATTPIPALIGYGEREGMRLRRQDGSVREAGLERLKEIAHGEAAWDFGRDEYAEAFVKNPLLKRGLIFMDTPGLNSMFEYHEQSLAQSLESVSQIFYVSRQAPDAYDVEKISALVAGGFRVSFVRTHCDEILALEEDEREEKRTCLSILRRCGIREEDSYFVSVRDDPRWRAERDALLQSLQETGANLKRSLELAVLERENILRAQCAEALRERISFLESAQATDESRLRRLKEEAFKRIEKRNALIERREANIRRDISRCQNEMDEAIREYTESFLTQSERELSKLPLSSLNPSQMEEFFRDKALLMAAGIEKSANGVASCYPQSVASALKEDGLPLNMADLPVYEDYIAQTSERSYEFAELRQQIRWLEENLTELEQRLTARENAPEFARLTEELETATRELTEVRENYQNFPAYQPQYILTENQEMQPSQLLRILGELADLALVPIRIPSADGTDGDAKQIPEQLANALDIGDKIHDVSYLLGKLQAMAGQVPALLPPPENGFPRDGALPSGTGRGNVLKYLTLSYWAEKFGKQFDEAPQWEPDLAYEREYARRKRDLTEQLLEKQRNQYLLNSQYRLFRDETERMRAERESMRVNERELRGLLEAEQGKLEAQSREKAMELWKSDCSRWFRVWATRQSAEMAERYKTAFSVQATRYQDAVLEALRASLRREREECEKLDASPNGRTREALETCKALFMRLEGAEQSAL